MRIDGKIIANLHYSKTGLLCISNDIYTKIVEGEESIYKSTKVL